MKKMKHLYFSLTILAAAAIIASCSSKNKAEQNSDSALTAEMESPVAGEVDYYLTADSIGPVYVGEQISDLPAAVANLYDYMHVTETPDAMAYTFLLADIPQFTIYDFMEGKVDVIMLEGNSREVMTPKGALRVGDEFSKVLALDGVESDWEGFDGEGVWYWKWNGLYFGVDEMGLSEKFAISLQDDKMPPKASEFTPDIKIGYIGTGLPF